MNIEPLVYWIKERHSIYLKRLAGELKPWTADPILQMYSFCNVYRELDKTTVWIRENWREQYRINEDQWFAMVVARLINWPATLRFLRPLPWKPQKFVDTLHSIKNSGVVTFGGAYIVNTNGVQMDKAEYLAKYILDPMWKDRKLLRPKPGTSLEHYYANLRAYRGMGKFMAAQVIADLKFGSPAMLNAADWWTFAAPGPGSLRGMNRIMERPLNAPQKEHVWLEELNEVSFDVACFCEDIMPRISYQDLQNCLCEFDKYQRTKLGEGRPRSTYPGAK